MTSPKRLLAGSAALVALSAALAVPAAAHAQAAPSATAPAVPAVPAAAPAAAPEAVISRVLVRGNQRVDAETVAAYLAVRPGDAFDPALVDLSLKTLFASGFFSDVSFSQEGGDLIVTVVENPAVNQVLFEGNSGTRTERLQEEVQIQPRSWFTRSRVQADRRRILEVYRRAGNFAATVTPVIRELPQNRVDLIFEIDEGPKTGVRQITFVGNDAFSDRQLQGVIATEESRWWRFFSNRDSYDPDVQEFDSEQLREFYGNEGYYNFRVASATAQLTPDQRDFYITYTVDEGQRYNFGDIQVRTQLDRLNAETLRAVVPIQSGQLFRREQVEQAVEAITFAAGAAGYAFVDVRPREVADDDGRTVAITFEVDEGPRVYVDRIDIIGNSATMDYVIRRELRIAEGDAFNRVLIDRSRNRVRALGFFREVEIEERRTLPDRTVVEVRVEEQATGELAFALGYSNSDAYQFDISVTQRNLRGRGQFLRFRISASSRTRNVDIRFTEPRFLGRNFAAGVDIFSVVQDFVDEAGFETQSTGLGLRGGFPLAEDRSLGLRYTYRTDQIIVPNFLCFDSLGNPLPDAAGICASAGDFTTSLMGYTFNWDRRNDPIRPTSGFLVTASQDLAGLGVGVQYLRNEVSGGIWRGLFPGWTASFTMTGGYIAGWGDDTVRINDRFFKGGQSFRGFEIAGVGPRTILTTAESTVNDPVTGLPVTTPASTQYLDALGGRAYAIGSFELTVPTPLPESYGIRSSLFVDVGTVGLLDDIDQVDIEIAPGQRLFTEDDLALRASAGLSVFWTSPFGPIRFDFSYPLAQADYDQTENFRFSTSTQF